MSSHLVFKFLCFGHKTAVVKRFHTINSNFSTTEDPLATESLLRIYDILKNRPGPPGPLSTFLARSYPERRVCARRNGFCWAAAAAAA